MKTIDEIRADNLRRLIISADGLDKLAGMLDKSPGLLGRLLHPYPGIKSNTIEPRGIGSKLAREMEFKLGKEPGWMDEDRGPEISDGSSSGHIGDRLRAAIQAKKVSEIDVARHFAVTPATVSVTWIRRGLIAKRYIPELANYFGLPVRYWAQRLPLKLSS